MKTLLEFLTNFYWISLPQTVAETFWYTDWESAYRRSGISGLFTEAIHSLLGTNTWPFFVSLDSSLSGTAIERLLTDHGIEMWGQGFANGELFFRVRKSKAAWAQYLLLREGVPLMRRLLAKEPSSYDKVVQPSGWIAESPAQRGLSLDKTIERELDAVIDRIDSVFDF